MHARWSFTTGLVDLVGENPILFIRRHILQLNVPELSEGTKLFDFHLLGQETFSYQDLPRLLKMLGLVMDAEGGTIFVPELLLGQRLAHF